MNILFVNMRLSLVGMMGSGKTSIGERISHKMKMSFVDIDEMICEEENMSIADIFKYNGEDYFRFLEFQTIKEVMKLDNIVIALGGGVFTNEKNIDLVNNNSTSVYLECARHVIFSRLKQSVDQNEKGRPTISGLRENELKIKIDEMMNQREVFYKMAHHIVNANNTTNAVNDIIKILS